MIKHAKIIGLQRTGTNWLEHLIYDNFNVKVYFAGDLRICFKHAMPDEYLFSKSKENIINQKTKVIDSVINDSSLLCIIIIKDPLLWLNSIHSNQVDLSFYRPQIFRNKKIVDIKALDLYFNFYEKWSFYIKKYKNITLISYHDLLFETENTLNKLSLEFKLQRKNSNYIIRSKVPQSKKYTKEDFENYYIRIQQTQELFKEKFINKIYEQYERITAK